MPYAILFAANGSDDFQPIDNETHEQGGDAAARMKELQAQDEQGGRYKVRAVAEPGIDPDAWRYREREQFDSERYIPCPWHDRYFNDALRWEHYAHLSLKEPGKIAYTASPEHGRADRQTTIAPGRYLTRYFSNELSADEIERLAAEVSVSAGSCSLTFTSDPDTIETVYCNGPSSCMSHGENNYDGHCHPVRAYGHSPDLQLVYIGEADDASGRAIVWPDKKLYSTPYGDCSRLRLLLDNEGYRYGTLNGARLKPLHDENGNGFIMPYVDGIGHGHLADGFIVLGSGNIYVQSTEGTSGDGSRASCDYCGNRYPEDELTYIEDAEGSWCDDCAGEYTTRCDHDEELYLDRRHSFHEVYRLRLSPYSGDRQLTSVTVVDCNIEDAEAIYHEASGEYLDSELYALVTAIEELAVAIGELPDLDPLAANQLDLALQTIAIETLDLAA